MADYFAYLFPAKIIGMIRNTDKKHKGTATVAVGTFGARKAGAGRSLAFSATQSGDCAERPALSIR
jgi:hypothetical protein